MTRQSFPGPFSTRNLGGDVWQLSAPGPAPWQVFLRLAAPGTAEALRSVHCTRLDLEWDDGGVTVALTGAGGVRRLQARSAIVHEPRPALYENLPLAAFDLEARRFWRRVFTLMRIPGGRWLLGAIARRNR